MAYATSNPPKLLVPSVGGEGPALWVYYDGDDDATVNGAGYFSNGVALGMRVGDFIFHFDTATPKGSVHYVATISGTTVTTAFAAVA